MATPIMFRSHYRICSDPSYAKLYLDLYSLPGRGGDYDVQLDWQANTRPDPERDRHWYAFTYEIRAARLEFAERALRTLRRLQGRGEKALRFHSHLDPVDVLARLRALRAVEVVYDPRVSELVPLDQLLPPDVHDWRDDYRAMGRPHCTTGCLARTEREAHAGIAAELAQNERYQEYLIAWLQAGRPVIDISDGVYSLFVLFINPQTPPCREACNANEDSNHDLSDAVFVLNFLFLGGPPPGALPDCETAFVNCAETTCQ